MIKSILFTILSLCGCLWSRPSLASDLCSGSYLADKDKGAKSVLASLPAKTVLHDYVVCGLQSVSKNGWQDVVGFDLPTLEAQISKIDVQYVKEIPSELLPPDQKGRGGAVFHHLNGDRWQILIVPDDLQKRFGGERYLLLFHELVSTLNAKLDQNFAATIEFEFKALQKNDPSLQQYDIKDILIPPPVNLTSGPITSGGGDSTLLWMKRQLRNYFIDHYLVPFMQGKKSLTKIQFVQIFQAISYDPMRLEIDLAKDFEWQKSSEGLRMLVVNPSFFHKNYEKYLEQTHDPDQAGKMSSTEALQILAESLKEKILTP